MNAEIEGLLELKDPEEIRDRFSDLESLADDLGNYVSREDAQRIEERIDEIKQENERYEDWDGDRSGEYSSPSGADENAAIDDLFDSMERE